MRILLIEDEKKTAAFLQKGLSENGFLVDIASDGQDGVFQASQQSYDLIILDVMLPKLDGWGVIQAIQQVKPHQRILFLTACDDVEEKVKGLTLGADDYLIKPFSFSELVARVRTILRRGNEKQMTMLQIADLRLDLLRRKAYRGNKKIVLSPKEFALLTFFAQHQGEVLSRTLLAERVWDIHFDCDTNVVDVAIRRLRNKVDDGFEIKLIHTVRGSGYVFEVGAENIE